MSWIVAIVVRLAALAGINVSPFAAGALFAGGVALLAGGGAIAGGLHLYNEGYRAADGAWQAKNLQAQIEAIELDRDAARRAAADARLKTATVEKAASDQKEGTDRYVADLESRAADAAKAGKPQCTGGACCALDDADIRFLRERTRSGRARARPAGHAGFVAASRASAGLPQGR